MHTTILQTAVFSKSPLKGFYRYEDLFQILPPKKQNELFQHDHPLILEIRFDQRIYPERETNLWHRDVWEEKRFEFIKRRSPDKKMELNDPWVEAFQEQTRMLRPTAILTELRNLLTLFSNYRFFTYDGKQSWFIPIQPGEEKSDSYKPVWGQIGYISENRGPIEDFTENTCDQMPIVPRKEYVKRFRDTKGYTKDDQIGFPDNINTLFNIYFSLPSIKKTAYYMACHLYNQALHFQSTIPSLSMVASVMAIEKLMSSNEEKNGTCSTCGAPASIEKCNECGTPIYRLRSRFREFMIEHSLPDQENLYKEMYDVRSRLAHGGLLREDLFDTGFYAGEKDNEDRLRRNSLIVVHDAMLHWLLKCQPSV